MWLAQAAQAAQAAAAQAAERAAAALQEQTAALGLDETIVSTSACAAAAAVGKGAWAFK